MLNYNPSGFLFPLTKLTTSTTEAVSDAIERLCLIYSKGDDAQLAGRRHGEGGADDSLARLDSSLQSTRKEKVGQQELVADSGYASAEEDEDCWEGNAEEFKETLQLVRSDSLERDFAVRWLTGFIARSSLWIFPAKQCLSDEETMEREALMEKAASVLACCAGAHEEDEELTRQFKFPLGHSTTNEDISVELNDLLASNDHSSVGLQSWASAIHFARMMCQDPSSFNIAPNQDSRVLELGAGTGILSIAAAKIINALRQTPSTTDIIATDYHPDVLTNLQRNVDMNFPSEVHSPVNVQLLDWQYPPSEPPFDEAFDTILAADVVYETGHAGWIKNCVERLLKRPTLACPEGGVFWMIIAVRNTGRHEGLAAAVLDVFPAVSGGHETTPDDLSLKSIMVQHVERSSGVGRADESGYRLFKICWA
ncbi:hypothetical protein M0805_003280 [Coniferiporia weirii]|nr:hypothetical protein M0805_003280 [Coniferiporia weirii]